MADPQPPAAVDNQELLEIATRSLNAPERRRMTDVFFEEHVTTTLKLTQRVVLYFYATWAKPCEQITTVLKTLRGKYEVFPGADNDTGQFLRIDVDKFPKLAKSFAVTQVPTVLLMSTGRITKRITGADAAALSRAMTWFVDVSEDAALTKACETLVEKGPVVLLLKGSSPHPRCPFCKRVVDTLRKAGVQYDEMDVMADAHMRERLKEVARWETYPMVFASGRFIGGVDVVERLYEERRLLAELGRKQEEPTAEVGADGPVDGPPTGMGTAPMGEDLDSRLRRLIGSAPVMLFMKGVPDAPRCGFSRKMVDLLRTERMPFESFDILQDNDVRQGLKKLSNWPTFPQLYAQGHLVGGLDVVKELADTGELRAEMGL